MLRIKEIHSYNNFNEENGKQEMDYMGVESKMWRTSDVYNFWYRNYLTAEIKIRTSFFAFANWKKRPTFD